MQNDPEPDTVAAQASGDTDPFSELLRQEAALRTLLSVAFDVSWEMFLDGSGDGRIRLLQDPSAELGFPPGEIPRTATASEWIQRLHPDDIPSPERALRYVLTRRQRFREEYRVRRADGVYTWWEEQGAPVEFQQGRPVRWVGVIRNVTERKQAEAALQRTLAELQVLKAQLETENVYLRETIKGALPSGEMIGQSAALKRVRDHVAQVAGTTAPVLITGETGTGKELVARAIYQTSLRRERPLVAVNCAALPTTLIESELFGHEKGAFTGATSQRVGRFELAHHGTILLDEVGECPLDLQAKLLRVLQTGEFERVGSSQTRHVDARVLASTNRNLEQAVERGAFRQDLYHRLRVFPIHVPPLRERREDIPQLVAYLVEKKATALGKRVERIARATMDTLTAYNWPGNVRELENVIERALILSRGPVFVVGEALGRMAGEPVTTAASGSNSASADDKALPTLAETERAHILRVCEACGWQIKGPGAAADRLGLNPSTLYFRMKKLGIRRPQNA